MRRDVAFWAAFWTSSGLLFWEADRSGWPLCGVVRTIFHTSHPVGRVAFTAAYGTGAVVLWKHVLKKAETLIDAS